MRRVQLLVVAALMSVVFVGCGNSLTVNVDGQLLVQKLPKDVKFPIVIEDITKEMKEAEIKKQKAIDAEAAKRKDGKRWKVVRAQRRVDRAAEQAQRDAERAKGIFVVRSPNKDRTLRITTGAKNGKIKSGSLAMGTFWFW